MPGRMAISDPSETLVKQLRRSRKTLEQQLETGAASLDVRDTLDRLAKLEKRDDSPSDSLIQRGDA